MDSFILATARKEISGVETFRSVKGNETTCLLSLALVGPLILMVNAAKVGNDDGNWQGDDQHSAE